MDIKRPPLLPLAITTENFDQNDEKYSSVRDLDSEENWKERTAVVTKIDHEQHEMIARGLLLDIVRGITDPDDIENVENIPPAVLVTHNMSMKKSRDLDETLTPEKINKTSNHDLNTTFNLDVSSSRDSQLGSTFADSVEMATSSFEQSQDLDFGDQDVIECPEVVIEVKKPTPDLHENVISDLNTINVNSPVRSDTTNNRSSLNNEIYFEGTLINNEAAGCEGSVEPVESSLTTPQLCTEELIIDLTSEESVECDGEFKNLNDFNNFDWEYLEKRGGTNEVHTDLSRCSLFAKFDPLTKKIVHNSAFDSRPGDTRLPSIIENDLIQMNPLDDERLGDGDDPNQTVTVPEAVLPKHPHSTSQEDSDVKSMKLTLQIHYEEKLLKKDKDIASKDSIISSKDEEIALKDLELVNTSALLRNVFDALDQLCGQLDTLSSEKTDIDKQYKSMESALDLSNKRIQDYHKEIDKLLQNQESLKKELLEKIEQQSKVYATVAELEKQVAERDKQLIEKKKEISGLQSDVAQTDEKYQVRLLAYKVETEALKRDLEAKIDECNLYNEIFENHVNKKS